MLKVDSVSVARNRTPVLHNISLTLAEGESLAVVGESGAGKSTLIAAVLGLLKLATGRISWCDVAVCDCRPALVMQEPRAAFNPVLRLRRSLLEPVIARGKGKQPDQLYELCDRLELATELLERRPYEISIGQAQRFGIVRAILCEAPLILFDEPLSALDAVNQKLTAQLLAQLQAEHGFAALIVTHDLGFAAAFADDIAVMRAGCVVEQSNAADFIAAPASDYGRKLRDAAIALGALTP